MRMLSKSGLIALLLVVLLGVSRANGQIYGGYDDDDDDDDGGGYYGDYEEPEISMLDEPECGRSWMNKPTGYYSSYYGRRRGNRIGGGENAWLGAFPSYVYITDTARSFDCGGTLIDKRMVLTSETCVGNRAAADLRAHVGYINGTKFDAVHPVAQVCRVPGLPNPGVRPPVIGLDMALIKLAGDVSFNAAIQPACRPDRPYYSPNPGTIVGMGAISQQPGGRHKAADELQFLTGLSYKPCEEVGSDEKLALCFVSTNGGACKGDIGGPLYSYDQAGRQVVHGIYSYGHCMEGDDPKHPEKAFYFTDVYKSKQYIKDAIMGCH